MNPHVQVYASSREMLQATRPLLESAGAEGELLLGLLLRAAAQETTTPVDVVLEPLLAMAVWAGDEPCLALIRTGTRCPVLTGSGCITADIIDWLVDELLRRAPDLDGVNGEQRWSGAVAHACAQKLGRTPRCAMRSIAHELRKLQTPPEVSGHWRSGNQADLELLTEWGRGFVQEALDEREQARSPDATSGLRRCLQTGDLLLWCDSDGRPVSMACVNRRTNRSSCISWVYTPPEVRGHGYASAVVAALTQRELDSGAEWVSLFTDADNPVSNRIYRRLGFEPRCTFAAWDLS